MGAAVTRNRVRRRLRALLDAEARRGLPPGWYLVGATDQVVHLPWPTLEAAVHGVAERIRREAAT